MSANQPQYRLFWVRLAFRAECCDDIEKVLTFFRYHRPAHTYVKEIHWKQSFLAPDMPVPDGDVEFLDLATWVEVNDNPLQKMTEAIKSLYEAIENIEDAHVVEESLNFKSQYDGSRNSDRHLTIDSNGIIVGLDPELKTLEIRNGLNH